MFKVNKNDTFWSKVTVMTPNEKGNMTRGEFQAEFQIISQDEFDEMVDDNWAFSAIVDKVVKQVKDVGDAEGNPLPADEAMEAVLNHTNAVSAMANLYIEKMQGGPSAPKGRTSRKRRNTG